MSTASWYCRQFSGHSGPFLRTFCSLLRTCCPVVSSSLFVRHLLKLSDITSAFIFDPRKPGLMFSDLETRGRTNNVWDARYFLWGKRRKRSFITNVTHCWYSKLCTVNVSIKVKFVSIPQEHCRPSSSETSISAEEREALLPEKSFFFLLQYV